MLSAAWYPRWLPLLLSFVVNIAVGMTTYAWSLFITPLQMEFGWSRAQIALALSLCCLTCGVVGRFAGKWYDRCGPRPVLLSGALLLTAGFMLSGYVQTLGQIYVTYGLMAGSGIGLLYQPPVALAPKWWPDRQALATGCVVFGLGLGSFLMGPMAATIMQAPDLNWRHVFRYCGIAMGLMSGISGILLREPSQKETAAGRPNRNDAASHDESRDYSHAETVRMPQFWELYAAFFAVTFAGILVIGHIAGHGIDCGLTAMQATTAVSALALTNSATRIISGFLADAVGFKKYFLVLCILQTACLLLLVPIGGNAWLLAATAACIGWNYGSVFTLFPAACVRYFGPTAQGSNYGLLFTSWGFAGFAGPWAGGLLKDVTGNYTLPFLTAAGASLVSAIIIARLKTPLPKRNQRHSTSSSEAAPDSPAEGL